MELVSQPSIRVVFETCMECVFRDAQGRAWDYFFEALHGARFRDLHKVVLEIPEIRDVQPTCVLQYLQMSALLWSGIWSVSPALFSRAFSLTFRTAGASGVGTPDETLYGPSPPPGALAPF